MKKQIRVKMQKFFLSGVLEGMTVEDEMTFTDWSRACGWAGSVTMSHKTNFVVLEMKGPNGEHANF